MTPFEFCLHGGKSRDGSDREAVELSVDRQDQQHPVQLSMYPWQRTPANEHIPGMTGFLTGDQVDELIDVLTQLRDRLRELTSSDPEPPPGTTVETEGGTRWTRYPDMWPGSWLMDEFAPEGDPETWRKVAGNYGPVRIVRRPS